MANEKKKCFVIMPISDPPEYQNGHFRRVYDYIIKPACERIGVVVTRADDVKSTNYIVIDILQRILASDIVVCDLSARNSNVMYELGIRQAFDKPVVLLKDKITDRVFDIQGLRTIDYDESLRVDTVGVDVAALSATVEATLKANENEVNSLVRLLSVPKATIADRKEISPDTALILTSMREMSQRISEFEFRGKSPPVLSRPAKIGFRQTRSGAHTLVLPNHQKVAIGDELFWDENGTVKDAGILAMIEDEAIVLNTQEGTLAVRYDDPRLGSLSAIPF